LASYTSYYYPAAAAMSPAAFQHRVTDFVAHLLRCREHCDAINANRYISREHGRLENLRAALKTASNSVWFEFNALRNVLGSRMDLGDETARHALSHNTRDLEVIVESRLRDVALRRIDGPAGFKDMIKKVERIEEKVKTAMIDLGGRLGHGSSRALVAFAAPSALVSSRPAVIVVPSRPKRRATTKPKKVKFVEVDSSSRHHLKDSWEETLVGNTVLYVNCYDRTKTTWVRPDGYIKPLPKPAVFAAWGPSVPTMALTRRDPRIQYRII
jgi:hypothetical protein